MSTRSLRNSSVVISFPVVAHFDAPRWEQQGAQEMTLRYTVARLSARATLSCDFKGTLKRHCEEYALSRPEGTACLSLGLYAV